MIRFAIYKFYIYIYMSLEGYMCVMHDVSTEHREKSILRVLSTLITIITLLQKVQDSDNQ